MPTVACVARLKTQSSRESAHGTANAHVRSGVSLDDTATVIDDIIVSIPYQIKLLGSYPNPFNSTTIIEYQLSSINDISMAIFNIMG